MTEALAAFLGKWVFIPIIGPFLLHLYIKFHTKVQDSVTKKELDERLIEVKHTQDREIDHLKETVHLEMRNILQQIAQNQERQESSNQLLQQQLSETNRKIETLMTKLEPMAEDLAVVKSKTNH